jgi:hypothetical protein
MRVIALDGFDNRVEGEEFEVSDKQGEQLLAKGLVKVGPVPQNKKATPSENTADPSEAAGEAPTSSASRAARPSVRKTAAPSTRGTAKKATKKAAK